MSRIPPETLETFAARLIEATGATEEVAAQVAESLVLADLAGHHSHGTHRLPLYTDWVAEGVIDPTATPEVEPVSPVAASVDGNNLFGQVVGRRAVEAGVERAREHGVGVVGIRDCSHLGRMGEWAERTARQGFLFASFVNSQGQGALVAPAGSTERKLGTNPLTFGVPTFGALEFPVVLDMATSQVAHGKISERETTGHSVPAGWAVDDEGEDLTDPEALQAGVGALRPLGGETSGYKGFGLAVIAELFAGLVGCGNVFGMAQDDPWSNGAAFVTIDPTRFVPEDGIEARVASLAAYLADAERTFSAGIAARGEAPETLLPGEGEHRGTEDGRENGIPMDAGILGTLADLAREQGLADEIPPEAGG